MRRTKLLVTVGPASSEPGTIDRLLAVGVDAFRLNFSHGSDHEHRATLRGLRAAGDRAGKDVAIVADLQGPKVRIGEIGGGSVELRDGQRWTFDPSGAPGDAHRTGVAGVELSGNVRRGDPILLGDGTVELRAGRVQDGVLEAVVVHGGRVTSHAGLYLPRGKFRTTGLSGKDRADLGLALSEGVDFVALSFVRSESDVRDLRRRMDRSGHREVGVIAKIERAEALRNLDGILEAADALMIARGDLGIEVPLERIALEQKRLAAAANAAHKPVIVATQMLLSMVHSPRPTRAEATDVANAVLDGADAVMLSEESAVGEFPVESAQWLDRICRTTEEEVASGALRITPAAPGPVALEESVADAAVRIAAELGAAAIVTPTRSGRTARRIAARRPATAVVALSSEIATRRRLALTWGVEARECLRDLSLDEMRSFAEALVGSRRDFRTRGPVVLTAGYPLEGRPTNLVTVLSPVGRPGSGRRGRGQAGARS